jgi:uncharacterized lipoprotein NlpE involved in copper resistance
MKKIFFPLAMLMALAGCQEKKSDVQVSLEGRWMECRPDMPQLFQGVELKAGGQAASIGMSTLLYDKWKCEDGNLILSGKSLGNGQTIAFDDTLRIVRQTPDTLVLGRGGEARWEYYRAETDPFVQAMDSLERQLPEGQSLHREIYKGTLPAASGPGIEYTVVLFTPADSVDNGLFRLTMNYIDAENGEDQLFLQQGELKGQRDRNAPEATTVLRLQPYGDDESVYFEKQQDGLLMLDRKGQVIQSDLNYKLKRW